MTQEDKRLLLKDLSARLSYGVICHTEKGNGHLCSINQTIFGTEYGININPVKRDYFNDSETEEQVIKPHLRPMSSMTSKEWLEYCDACVEDEKSWAWAGKEYKFTSVTHREEYLNAHHFDYRGLIEKELALEAPADMYKTE